MWLTECYAPYHIWKHTASPWHSGCNNTAARIKVAPSFFVDTFWRCYANLPTQWCRFVGHVWMRHCFIARFYNLRRKQTFATKHRKKKALSQQPICIDATCLSLCFLSVYHPDHGKTGVVEYWVKAKWWPQVSEAIMEVTPCRNRYHRKNCFEMTVLLNTLCVGEVLCCMHCSVTCGHCRKAKIKMINVVLHPLCSAATLFNTGIFYWLAVNSLGFRVNRSNGPLLPDHFQYYHAKAQM